MTDPLRPAPVDAATLSVTVAAPFPDDAPTMLIQGAPLSADHAQPDDAFTEMVTSPPVAGAECVVGVT